MSKDSTSSSSSSSSSSSPLQSIETSSNITRSNLTADEQRELNEKLFEETRGKKENLTLVKKLINQGADVNTVSGARNTPLHYAARNGYTETAIALLQNRANPNAMNSYGDTPLHEAASFGHTEAAIALLQNGADVKAVNNYGNTPLHGVASKEHAEIAIVLLQNGANPNAVNSDGYTPLHRVALLNRYTAIATTLLQNGANPSARGNNGETAFDIAERDAIRSLLINCINFQKELKSIFDKMVESFSKIRAERNGKEEASASSPQTDIDETLKAVRKKFEEDSIELLSNNEGLLSPEFNPFDMAIDNKNHSVFHLMANEALKLGDGTERNQYLELLAILAKESRNEKIQEMINGATTISEGFRPEGKEPLVASVIEEIIVSYLYDNDTKRTQASQTNIDDNLATALHLAANKGYLIASNQPTSSLTSLANNPKKPGIMDRFLNTIFCRNNAAADYPATNMAAAASSSSTYSGSKEEEKSAPAARSNNPDNQMPATFIQNPSAAATTSKYQQNKR